MSLIMALRLNNHVATLFLAIFCPLIASAAESASRNDVSIDAPVSRSTKGPRILWKRRRGGGSSSDSDYDSDSDSGDYGYDDSSSSSGSGGSDGYHTCFVEKNVTREAHSDGYWSFYSVGNGKETSLEGGYTPEGSGTSPSWDNSSGSWDALEPREASYLDDPAYISYLGGAAVPYPAGKTSPNGVEPEKFLDLPYEPDLSPIPSSLLCNVPNSNYAYKYKEKFNWTSISFEEENYGEYVTRWVPVYCCCGLNTLCGCDDHHRNSSFVAALTQWLGLGMSPRNTTDVCAIDIEGKTTLLVKGELMNGSTKADRTVSYMSETVSTTVTTQCAETGGSASGARAQLQGPSPRAVAAAWAAVVAVGGLVGMGVVLL
ncbi:hypothetical protein BDW72DRAFT_209894 [Aspergillus terricola var. indicus]